MRRSGGWLSDQHRLGSLSHALVGVGIALGLLLVLSSSALAVQAPVIGSTVAYGVTQSDGTLEAWIDPGELPEGAYYQFQVVANTSEYLPELVCPEHGVPLSKPDGCGGPDIGSPIPGALPIGYIEKEPQSRYVRVDLAAAGMTLKPGTTYHYRVLAAKRVQSEDTLNWEGPPAVGPDQTFTTLTPGTPPAIESESASHITSTDATLEAKIDPEGLATTYEFYLEAPSCANDKRVEACEAGGGIPIAKGSIPAGSAAQTVSVDVAGTGHSLTPDTIEGYRVVASNSAGTTDGPFFNTFTTLPGPSPVIDSVSVSHLTATDATLEAQINTEGLTTSYEFQMWSSPCSKHGSGCELLIDIPLPSGLILGSFVSQGVSLDLNSAGVTLGGGEYGFSVRASSKAGETEANGGVFEAPSLSAQPLGIAAPSTTSGASKSGASSTPIGSGGSSPSSGVTSPGSSLACLCDCGRGCHGKNVVPKHLSRAQKLSKALQACKRQPKSKRAACQKQARKQYGAVVKKSKKR
jgi:hypothetical protein